MTSKEDKMDDTTQQAYDWAINQNYQTVAADYARTLAQYIEKISAIAEIRKPKSVAAGPWLDGKDAPKDGRMILASWDNGRRYDVVRWRETWFECIYLPFRRAHEDYDYPEKFAYINRPDDVGVKVRDG